MALKDKAQPNAAALNVLGETSTTPATANAAAFEGSQETLAGSASAVETHDEAVASAAAATSTAIAKAASTAVALSSPTVFGAHLPEDMKLMLRELDFGVLPRIIADQGGLSVANEKIDLGKYLKGQILDVQNQYIASPGSDSEEAKKLVKYSKDGVTLDDGTGSAAQYIESLRLDGYNDADLKHYLNIVVSVIETDDAEAGEEFCGQLVVIQMSPESRKKFQRYMLNARMKSITTGSLDGLDVAKFSAVKKSGSGRNWTEIETNLA